MVEEENIKQTGIVIGKPGGASNLHVFIDGSTRSHAALKTAAIGLGTYKPGWQWSLHAGPQVEKPSENHIGYVISGHMMVKDPVGNEAKAGPGEAFEISSGSDAWVVGDEPCIALDFIPLSKSVCSSNIRHVGQTRLITKADKPFGFSGNCIV